MIQRRARWENGTIGDVVRMGTSRELYNAAHAVACGAVTNMHKNSQGYGGQLWRARNAFKDMALTARWGGNDRGRWWLKQRRVTAVVRKK
jgi:hypothetical protein